MWLGHPVILIYDVMLIIDQANFITLVTHFYNWRIVVDSYPHPLVGHIPHV